MITTFVSHIVDDSCGICIVLVIKYVWTHVGIPLMWCVKLQQHCLGIWFQQISRIVFLVMLCVGWMNVHTHVFSGQQKSVVLRVVVHLGMLGGFGGGVCGGVLVWWAGKNGRTHATTTKCIEDGWHDLMNLYVGHCMIRVIKCGQHVFGVMVGSVASYGAVHRLTHHGRQGKAKMNHGKADNG